jgi:putative solute:sodium symporter small subunit
MCFSPDIWSAVCGEVYDARLPGPLRWIGRPYSTSFPSWPTVPFAIRWNHFARTSENQATAYWRANLKLIACLLLIWFTVSFGFGILFVEQLNDWRFFGFKLGFWWAQQGAMYVFVALIFVYAALMRRLDRRFGVAD